MNNKTDIINWIESHIEEESNEEQVVKFIPQLDIKKYDIVYKWTELPSSWKKKLLSNNFYIKNCLGDGNCQFRAIATALLDNTKISRKLTHTDIRETIAKYIRKLTIIDFRNILDLYKLEYTQDNNFQGNWNPLKIKTKKEFITYLLKGGFDFQGDNITLSLISSALSVDFIIFDNENMNIINLTNDENINKYIIILYYDNNHYQTIGYKIEGKVVSFFKRKNLPKDIKLIINKKKLLYKHCEIIFENCKNITLNDFLNDLYQNSFIKLNIDDKENICKFLKLKNE